MTEIETLENMIKSTEDLIIKIQPYKTKSAVEDLIISLEDYALSLKNALTLITEGLNE